MTAPKNKRQLLPYTIGFLLASLAVVPVTMLSISPSSSAITGQILEVVEQRYVEPVDTDVLLETGLNLMLKELDPYSQYFSPERAQDFEQEVNGTLFGIGIVLRIVEEDPMILHVVKNGPADQAGVIRDSRLLSVDGAPCSGWTMSQVSQAIRGPRGTRVLLELEKDDQRQEFSPIRDEVTIPSITEIARIQTAPTEPALGLIRIQQFQPDTSLEVELAISRLLEEDIQGIIIDLRDNPGGILSEAVDFCSLFLEEGLTVVSTRNRRDNVDSNVEQVKKTGPFLNVPLVLLINGDSASASETVSAALRDHDRGVLVGARSYGKWTVQGLFQLPGRPRGGLLKLTTDSFFPPHGKRLLYSEKNLPNGLLPDIEIEVPEERQFELSQSWVTRSHERLEDPNTLTLVTDLDPLAEVNNMGQGDATLSAAVELLKDPARWNQLLQAPPLSRSE